MRSIGRSLSLGYALVAAVAFILGSTGVVAAIGAALIPDAENVIHACYNSVNGQVRIVESAADCKKNQEIHISWNARGPQGPTGATGPQGPAGSPGIARIAELNGTPCTTASGTVATLRVSVGADGQVALVCGSAPPPPAAACADGVDNDADGLSDGEDPGCAGSSDTSERGSGQCDDGLDNDLDTRTDFRPDGRGDLQCDSPSDANEEGPLACGDGIDNDRDGFTDYPDDPGCYNSEDAWEVDLTECNDGLDNDGDGGIDFFLDPVIRPDPDCSSPSDPSEAAAAALVQPASRETAVRSQLTPSG